MIPPRDSTLPEIRRSADDASRDIEHARLQFVVISDIVRWSPYNDRARMPSASDRDDATLVELASSIVANGVLQPITVRQLGFKPSDGSDAFEGIFGSRRVRAALLAGLDHIPALVRELTDNEALEAITIENLQRQDLTPLQEADQLARLFDADTSPPITVADVALRIGKSARYVRQRLQFRALDAKVRAHVDALPLTHLQQLARLQPAQQLIALRVALGTLDRFGNVGALSKRVPTAAELRDYIARQFFLDLKNAPWDVSDAQLVVAAGACTMCPKRSGSTPDLFGDIKGDVCTDPACYESKRVAFVQLKYREATRVSDDVRELRDATPTKARAKTNGAAALRVTPISMNYQQHDAIAPRVPTLARPLTREYFQIARAKTTCEHMERAFVVDGGHDEKLGSVVNICRDAKCKVHHAGASVAHSPSDDKYAKQQRARDNAVKRERVARRAVLAAACARIVTSKRALALVDRRQIALAVFQRLWNDSEKHVLAALHIDLVKHPAKTKQLRVSGYASERDRVVAVWIEKATPWELDALLAACAYAPLATSDLVPDRTALEQFAKRVGVNVAATRNAIAKTKATTGASS